MGKTSEAILTLKPVTFRYKKELDPQDTPQFGLVAEEVAKVSSDLVKRDRDGKLQTVRYEAVNAMLLNEFLKERRKVEGLEAAESLSKKKLRNAAALQKAPRVWCLFRSLPYKLFFSTVFSNTKLRGDARLPLPRDPCISQSIAGRR